MSNPVIGTAEFQDVSDIYFEDDDNDSDTSIFSISEMDPQSVNVNFSNGSPLNDGDFTIVHFNINSITAEGRLEQLTDICLILKVDCLVITESKLCEEIPNSLISLSGYHEPVRKDRNRNGGGCLIYINESLTFKQIKEKESPYFEHLWWT